MHVPEITADDLAERLERGEQLQVLDVRAPGRAAAGHIESPRYLNVPNLRLLASLDPEASGLTRDLPVAVVCDRGVSSRMTVFALRQLGYDAHSVAGGMLAWSLASVARPIAERGPLDALIQFDRLAKGALAYLLVRRGEALLVDPGRDLTPYGEELERLGARLVGVVDTHAHADYLSGAANAAERWGAPYYLHPRDAVSPYDGRRGRLATNPLPAAGALRLGDLEIAVESTPGHTEGSVTLRLGDELALTGDFVFVESIGRPDLGDRAEPWTAQLWESLERARATWPAGTRILPAHYAAETERNPDRTVGRPFGELPERNVPLSIRDRRRFHAWVAARCGGSPDAYRAIKLANLGLLEPSQEEAAVLEAGRNQCALAG